MIVEIAATVCLVDANFAATEAVATEDRMLLCPVDAPEPAVSDTMLMLDYSASEMQIERREIASPLSRYGPKSWGVMENTLYFVDNLETNSAWLACGSELLSDLIPFLRELRKEGHADREAETRMRAYSAEHGRQMEMLTQFVNDQARIHDIEHDAWDLFIDLAYTASNHVMFISVRQGELHWWTFNKPEEADWVDRGTMSVDMAEGAFRIVQGGGDLYLVDKEGRVYSSPERGAKMLGQISGWGEPREGEQLILLEEQNADKIAVVRVMGEDITPLRFNGDSGAMEDFLEEIADEELRAALVRMAEILEEDEGGDE